MVSEPGALRYDVDDIDIESDSTHARVVRLVGTGKRVLELGCATGYMSRVFRNRGCQVVAVEIDREAAAQAEASCERVIVGDLDQLELTRELSGERFDVAVAADVLEHLKDPLRTVRYVKQLLRPDGCFVASIPNFAHGSVRLALLEGRLPYGEVGLLDHTHLRFFTRVTMERLFEDAGYVLGHLERQQRPIEATEVPFDREAVPAGLMESLSRDPEALTYQFVVVAYPVPRAEFTLLQRRFRELTEAKEAAERAVASLQQTVQEQAGLERQLRELAKEKEARERENGELRRRIEEGTELVRRIRVLTEQKETAESDVTALRQALAAQAEVEQRIHDLVRVIEERAELEHRVGELAEGKEAAERRTADQDRYLHELAEEKERLEREVTALRATLAERVSLERCIEEFARAVKESSEQETLLGELAATKEAAEREAAELRQVVAARAEETATLAVRAELATDLERDLRDMLLAAQDQLLRRDADVQMILAGAAQADGSRAPA